MPASPLRINQEVIDSLPLEERRAVEDNLKELASYLENNPLYSFVPHTKQIPFLSSKDRLAAFLGGNRAGKTTALIVDALIQTVDPKYLPPHLREFKRPYGLHRNSEGPFFARLIAPDFTATLEGVIFPKIRELVPRQALKKGNWDEAFHKERRMLFFEDGSWWQFMTHEQDIDKFGGAALHYIGYDEEPPEQIRKECLIRLQDYQGEERFSFTPLRGLDWAFKEIWEKRNQPGLTVVTASVHDNPHMSKEAIDYAMAALSSEERQAREQGHFIHFGGMVYPQFSKGSVVPLPADMEEFLKDNTVVVGIDPGLQCTAAVWGVFDHHNDLLVFDELKLENIGSVEVAVHAIREKNKRWGVEPDMYVIDPAARVRGLANPITVEALFHRLNIFPIHANNDLEAGILIVKRRFEAGSLLLANTLIDLPAELTRYRIDQRSEKFKTIKRDDHLCDALRYLVTSRTWTEPVKQTKERGYSWEKVPAWNPTATTRHPFGPV